MGRAHAPLCVESTSGVCLTTNLHQIMLGRAWNDAVTESAFLRHLSRKTSNLAPTNARSCCSRSYDEPRLWPWRSITRTTRTARPLQQRWLKQCSTDLC